MSLRVEDIPPGSYAKGTPEYEVLTAQARVKPDIVVWGSVQPEIAEDQKIWDSEIHWVAPLDSQEKP